MKRKNEKTRGAKFEKFYRLALRTCVPIGRKRACYTMWISLFPPFDCAVEVHCGEDRIRRILPRGFFEGCRFYRLIVRGAVTPCTLDDIMSDFYGKT